MQKRTPNTYIQDDTSKCCTLAVTLILPPLCERLMKTVEANRDSFGRQHDSDLRPSYPRAIIGEKLLHSVPTPGVVLRLAERERDVAVLDHMLDLSSHYKKKGPSSVPCQPVSNNSLSSLLSPPQGFTPSTVGKGISSLPPYTKRKGDGTYLSM